MPKNVTVALQTELAGPSTKLARLFKIIITLPGAAAPLKVIRITDHDQNITFTDD